MTIHNKTNLQHRNITTKGHENIFAWCNLWASCFRFVTDTWHLEKHRLNQAKTHLQAKLGYEMPVCEPAIIKHSGTELFRSVKSTAKIDARCVCYLSCRYDKMPDRNTFKEERLKVACSFVCSAVAGRTWHSKVTHAVIGQEEQTGKCQPSVA